MSDHLTDSERQAIVATFSERADQAVAQNDQEGARAWMEGVVELDDMDVEAWLRLASLIPDRRERLACYAHVLELSPGNPQAKAGIRREVRGR